MINTYYYVNTSAEVEAILRDGFINECKETTTGISGVYLADSPGEPDPEYPNDQLLEIILPPEISISQFELFKEGARWREWLVPAGLLNECAEIRVLPKAQWAQKCRGDYCKRMMQAFDYLIADGYLVLSLDSEGQPMFRNGEPVYKLTEDRRPADGD